MIDSAAECSAAAAALGLGSLSARPYTFQISRDPLKPEGCVYDFVNDEIGNSRPVLRYVTSLSRYASSCAGPNGFSCICIDRNPPTSNPTATPTRTYAPTRDPGMLTRWNHQRCVEGGAGATVGSNRTLPCFEHFSGVCINCTRGLT